MLRRGAPGIDGGIDVKSIRMALFGALLAVAMAGCGSGGGQREFDADQTSVPGTAAPASVELTKSAPSISSDGRQAVRLFATVKDAGNAALVGIPVAFATSGTGASISVVNAQTDANGQAVAALSIDDPTNRTIAVTASAGGRSGSTQIEVVGTTVAVSGPASVVVGTPATFEVMVRDASGAPVVGKAVTVVSERNNALSVSPATTSSLGTASITLTASTAAADTLTARAAGATGTHSVQVSSTLVAFDAPAVGAQAVVSSAPVAVAVRVLDNGAPVVGAKVAFTATRGVLTAPTLTDGNGVATTTIASTLAGRSLITATAPNGTVATREIAFVADRAAKLEVQASPSTVGVNLSGSKTESAQIVAVVRDSADNPVKGARVNFSAVDPSAGLGLSPGYALTDDMGRATVTFYPGALSSGTNAIVVTGTVDCGYLATGVQCVNPGVPPTDETRLTAARRALQIRIGTGNEIYKVPDPIGSVYNEMPYGVLVTDSAGNPVSGVTLNATLMSLRYGKGVWTSIPCGDGEPCWKQNVDAVCASEDTNLNLMLDAGEDLNLDGVLTPGNVGLVYFGTTGTIATGTSDTAGSAVLRIRYLRDRGGWVTVRLRVTASVPDGTEGAEEAEFVLSVLASDLTNPLVPPPGQPSPFGVGQCP